MSDKKPVWSWATVSVVMAILYVGSFGPARALYVHRLVLEWTYGPAWCFHVPVLGALPRLPCEIREPYMMYIETWVPWLDPVQRR
jgi:hypothetical protein